MADGAAYLSIDEVARDTGLGKDTLRVWERRYGFPNPSRSTVGERLYAPAQLERLRLICRLIDLGYRPGRVVPLADKELQTLADEQSRAGLPPTSASIAELLTLLAAGKTQAYKSRLRDRLEAEGPERFVHQTAAPLLALTGEAWARGTLPVYLEHFATQQLGGVIHAALARLPVPASPPRVLLATLPGESHGMGLLLVELLLAVQGVEAVNLGVETPVDQLQQACERLQPQAVALSFSVLQKRSQVIATLRELEAKLPPDVLILAGGDGITRLRAIPKRVRVVKQLSKLKETVSALRRYPVFDAPTECQPGASSQGGCGDSAHTSRSGVRP